MNSLVNIWAFSSLQFILKLNTLSLLYAMQPTLNSAVNRVQRARKDLKATLGKHPDDVELAKFTGLSLDKIKSTEKCLRMVGSIEQKVGRDTDVKFFVSDIILEVKFSNSGSFFYFCLLIVCIAISQRRVLHLFSLDLAICIC